MLNMPLFTFVTEKSGGTYIEQIRGASLEEAVLAWHKRSHTIPGPYEPDGTGITPVTGVRNVWCITGIDPADRFYIVHIVGTL